MRLTKGHGTQNDFLVLRDLDGEVNLTPELVRALCDRRSGIGADGVLRVVRSENDPDAATMAAEAPWFMDYRNADGSVAEMCGNGLRVFMRYLQRGSLVEHDATVATRGGIRRVRASGGGDVTVQMGLPRFLADRPIATVALISGGSLERSANAIEMPNPHVIVRLDDAGALTDLDLTRSPGIVPPLPEGQNVEFVARVGPRHLAMRVHERGSGETRSCGTGICAVAVDAATIDGTERDGSPWQVDVPGGTCWVTWREDGNVELCGPAVLLAEIDVDDAWLRGAAVAARDDSTAEPSPTA